MINRECHCLLCQDPVEGNFWDDRDRRNADTIQQFGWSSVGVHGDGQTPGWAYSIGMWHSLGHPEVAVFGFGSMAMMKVVNVVGDRVTQGKPFKPNERRSDVIERYDVAIRPIQPKWYKSFFGAAIDFYQVPPLPMLQLIWPDRDGRLPWEPDADPAFAHLQPMLWLKPEDHPAGIWTEYDPKANWPFGTTLGYHTVETTRDVADGTSPVVKVSRPADREWRFAGASTTDWVQMRLADLVLKQPSLKKIGELPVGQSTTATADGRWTRDPIG